MSYPTLEQFRDAMQYPHLVLTDRELKNGTVATTGLKLPLALCGGFAYTYILTSKNKKYAIRCFRKQSNQLERRYRAISNRLKTLNSPYFVDFEFQPQGIHINNQAYPIVKMAWASGKTLGEFLYENHHNKTELHSLSDSLRGLSLYLESQHIAHGDIQTGNVMVSKGGKSIQLIDYDGMFVEELESLGSAELGLPNFQHPQRTSRTWDDKLDRFSIILLTVALSALKSDPGLWDSTNSDDTAFLFRENDFDEPGQSDIFQALFSRKELSVHAKNLAFVCKSPYEKIPTLEDFLAQKNIPKAPIAISTSAVISPLTYRSVYPVLDASKYSDCLLKVGEIVELVGEIIEIKQSYTRYGKPYVFLNFGHWKGKIVKLTIWSEGLEIQTQIPDKSWEGKWISVVGLMDPPYVTSSYSHLSINITQPNQMHLISSEEGHFRLGISQYQQPRAQSTRQENIEKLRKSLASINEREPQSSSSTTTISPKPKAIPSGYGTPVTPPSSKSTLPLPVNQTIRPGGTQVNSPTTKNQSIVRTMKSALPTPSLTQATPAQKPTAKPTPKPARQKRSTKSIPKTDKIKTDTKILLGIFLLILISICLSLLSSGNSPPPTPTRIPTATLRVMPRSTPTIMPTSTMSVAQIASTEKAKCLFWNKVDRQFRTHTICVFGTVINSRVYFHTDGSYFYTLVRFSDDIKTFYIITNEHNALTEVGECVKAEGVLLYDPNDVPFMEISEVSRFEYGCTT